MGLPDRVTIRPRDGCVVKNETYEVGNQWNEGCEYTCTCSEKLEILCQVNDTKIHLKALSIE